MDRVISILVSISLACILAIYSGCGENATDNLDDIVPSPTSPTPGPSPTPSPGSATAFSISVGSSLSDASYVHRSTGFSDTCSIESTVAAGQDITCYIEMPEADVVYRDLPLVYSMPAGMCRYLSRGTYWFYNEEIGIGPASLNISVSKTITEDASGTQTVSYSTDHDCTVDGVLDTDCDGQPEITTEVKTDGTVTHVCVYDRSTEESSHNCCLGEYTYTLTTTTDLIQPSGTTTTITTSSVENKSWGGSVGSCIGGPGKTDWTSFDVDGYPAGLYTEADAGVAETYTIKNPNSVQQIIIDDDEDTNPRSFHTANYYTVAGASTDHTHSGYVSATTSFAPYFIDPIDDRNGSAIQPPLSYYSFECLDEGYETLHRIRVYVREWDTRADYDQYIATTGVTATPDRRGQYAPSGCVGLSGACNDYYDNDDFLSALLNLPAYDTATPSNRKVNFPYIKYK